MSFEFAWWGFLFLAALALLFDRWLGQRENARIDRLLQESRDRQFYKRMSGLAAERKKGGGERC